MKRNLHIYITIIALCFYCSQLSAQQISVNSNITLQDLIENSLENGCVDITNVTSSINGISNGFSSYGEFNRSSSNFPLENGFMLSTGNAESGGNNNSSILNDGSNAWGTDPDIETYIPGLSNTFNATSIEFDIISSTDLLQFNYLIASEEYIDANACSSNDSFAFLIKEGDATSANPYTNIALLPSSTTPISVSNIRREISTSCPAQNQQFFEGFNFGDTNYTGRTTVLTASSSINLNTVYHIKLIIADQRDFRFDSAVFIQANSLRTLDLPDSHETCANTYLINADIGNPQANYRWYRDGTLLTGEISSTILATSTDNNSHTYRVEVTVPLGNTTCDDNDEIVVTLNTDEPFTYNIEYALCDDPANGIGVEPFDLTTKNDEILANSPFTNTTVSYHPSLQEARDNINSITRPTDNLTTPTIFVRVDDADSNCNAFPSFDLVINPLPVAHPILDVWPLCDENDDSNSNVNSSSDGFRVIDLSLKDSEITNGQTDVTVVYYRNIQAGNGVNPIIDKTTYINQIETGDTVYARVINTTTGCFSENLVPLVMDISRAPEVNNAPDNRQYIDACEPLGSNSASFDLNDVINNIVGSLTNYTPYFYEFEADADAGNNNFIANPTAFTDIDRNNEGLGVQVLYLRVQDNTTGCASVVPFEIHSNLLSTGTQLGTYALCDDDIIDGNDRIFNLFTVESYISNNLPLPVRVTFYEDEDHEIEIPKTNSFPVNTFTTLYITLDNGNCLEENQINLRINPILIFDPVEPKSFCDSDSDGFMDIDLHTLDDEVTNNDSNFTVTYYSSFSHANADIPDESNRLTTFRNTTEETIIYARIQSNIVGITCHNVSTFIVKVFPAPATNTPNNICAVSNTQENLELTINQIVTDPTNLSIEFFKTLIAANSGDISSPDWISHTERINYPVGTSTQEIFVQIKNNTIGQDCNPYAIESFFINIQPNIDPSAIIRVCKDRNSTDPPIRLINYDDYIINGQTDSEVLYFNASNGSPIDKNIDIPSFNGPIIVRVQSIINNGCYTEETLPVTIANNPEYAPITTLVECIAPGDPGPYVYDLEKKRNEINQTSSETLIITFHNNQNNANDNILDIPNQNAFASPNLSETFYVRIESPASGCFEVESIEFLGLIRPNIIDIRPYTVCDDGADGDFYNARNGFDLTSIFNNDNEDTNNLFRIEGNRVDLSTIEINYFEDINDINPIDGFDNTNAIVGSRLTNFIADNNTPIYIKIFSRITECFDIFPFELFVNTPPNINTLPEVPECYDISNQYDLNQLNGTLVSDVNLVNISYYSIDSSSNRIDYTNGIFNYTTTGNYTIWVNIEDQGTLCSIDTSFTLAINQNPEAFDSPDLYVCDDNTDTTDARVFNLLDNESNIRGLSQPNTQFDLTFYANETDATNKTNAIGDSYNALNGEIIYARLENRSTTCFDITQFNVYINTKPIISLRDREPLCDNQPRFIDANTGISGDVYTWKNEDGDIIATGGDNESEQWFTPAQVGQSFNLTITRPNFRGEDCSSHHTFTLIASQTALIDFTPTVDYVDPNSITILIDLSRIGDYLYILDLGLPEERKPQTSNIFNDVSFGPHTVTVRDKNGCMDISKNVFVLDVPKFVTPNNDDVFDTWHIIGIERLPGTIVYIYNRHGKLLKTLPHTSLGWDGTYNGQNMPSDDYWYSADVIENGNSYNLRGHFTLKR